MIALTGINLRRDRVEWNGNVWHLCDGLALVRGETRGYGGPVHLLAALKLQEDENQTDLIVVRGLVVTRHQETPGIADFINQPEHSWLKGFINLDADQIDQVDAVTGATITSRAILQGLNALTVIPDLETSGCAP